MNKHLGKLWKLSKSAKRYVCHRVGFWAIKARIRICGVPRVLNYSKNTNAAILKTLGARIGERNVRLLSPITVHRADLKTDFSNLTISNDCVLNGNNYLDVSASVTLEKGVSLGPGNLAFIAEDQRTMCRGCEGQQHALGLGVLLEPGLHLILL